jgi:hypothetical protein
VVDAAVKASSWSLENFWKSSSVAVICGAPFIESVSHPKRGEPAMNAICALHNGSQGDFVALQQNCRPAFEVTIV